MLGATDTQPHPATTSAGTSLTAFPLPDSDTRASNSASSIADNHGSNSTHTHPHRHFGGSSGLILSPAAGSLIIAPFHNNLTLSGLSPRGDKGRRFEDDDDDDHGARVFGSRALVMSTLFISVCVVGATVAALFLPFAQKAIGDDAQQLTIAFLRECNTTTTRLTRSAAAAAPDVVTTSACMDFQTARPCREFVTFLVMCTSIMVCVCQLIAFLFMSLAVCAHFAVERKRRVVMFVLVFSSFALALSVLPLLGALLALLVPDPCRGDATIVGDEGFTPGAALYLQIAALLLNALDVVLLSCGGAGASCVEGLHTEAVEVVIERHVSRQQLLRERSNRRRSPGSPSIFSLGAGSSAFGIPGARPELSSSVLPPLVKPPAAAVNHNEGSVETENVGEALSPKSHTMGGGALSSDATMDLAAASGRTAAPLRTPQRGSDNDDDDDLDFDESHNPLAFPNNNKNNVTGVFAPPDAHAVLSMTAEDLERHLESNRTSRNSTLSGGTAQNNNSGGNGNGGNDSGGGGGQHSVKTVHMKVKTLKSKKMTT